MIITYPHMGSLSWLLGALFREQGIPFISPPPCSKQTLEVEFAMRRRVPVYR
ncbi:MAG: hypothetical protein ACLTXL_11015 [Clostridia bacterium]